MKTEQTQTKYWIIVVSKNHLEIGKSLGITQANHGKLAPMQRLQPGDYIVYYSPKVTFEGSESLKKFTAIAKVKDGIPYQADMGGGFMPFRRDVEYLECNEVDIAPLIPNLDFIKNKKSWGFIFRFGFFEIPQNDFQQIAKAMSLQINAGKT